MSANSPRTTALIFARNLRLMRETLKLTQQNLADLIDVSKPSVTRYESTKQFNMPQPETIDKLANVLGVRIADLFSPDGASAKRATTASLSKEDLCYMINRHLENAGLQLRVLKTKDEK